MSSCVFTLKKKYLSRNFDVPLAKLFHLEYLAYCKVCGQQVYQLLKYRHKKCSNFNETNQHNAPLP